MKARTKTGIDNPEELMRLYKKTGDMELRNQLVLHYVDAVQKAVMSMRSTLPINAQYEDLVNQGILALIDCIDKYDPDRGAAFETYIYKRLRGAVLSYMRKQSWIPYRVRSARRSILQERDNLSSELLREPTQQELAQRLDMSEKELDKYLQEISNAEMLSFEELLENAGQLIEGSLESSSPVYDAPEGKLLAEELKEVLKSSIEELPRREREVITLCYYENLNLREIGEVLGISQQRASCARTTGLQKLNKKLKKYLDGKDEKAC